MKSRLVPRFLGGEVGDPCLLVDLEGRRRGLIIDLGEAPELTSGIARRTTELLISHTHLDHFAGFSRLLRHVLDQRRVIRIWGPAGIGDNVAGALASFTWNYPEGVGIEFEVAEWGEAGLQRLCRFAGGDGFRRRPLEARPGDPSLLFADELIAVRAAVLDHGVPVLAFAVEEAPFLNVDSAALFALGLPPGPWVAELKRQAALPGGLRGAIETPVGPRPAARLIERLIVRTPGHKLAYVTDTLHTAEVERRVVALARDADLFYCEHMFAEAEAELARWKKHLTARQAGLLAARAGVRELRAFHFSRRHGEDRAAVVAEGRAAWLAARGGAGAEMP